MDADADLDCRCSAPSSAWHSSTRSAGRSGSGTVGRVQLIVIWCCRWSARCCGCGATFWRNCGRRRHGGRWCCLPAASALWLASALLDCRGPATERHSCCSRFCCWRYLAGRFFGADGAAAFLFFLVPFGAFLVPMLQTFTAAFTVHGLQLLGIPVFADGYIIQIPAGKFEVAEACAGLRFLIASIVFGCFFATIVYRSIVASRDLYRAVDRPADRGERVPCPGSCSARSSHGERRLGDGRPILYGWLFFTIVTLVLIAIGISFREGTMPPDPAADDPLRTMPADAPAGRRAARAGDGRRLTARPRRTGVFLLGGARLGGVDRERRTALPSRRRDGAWMREPDTAATGYPRPTGPSTRRSRATIADRRRLQRLLLSTRADARQSTYPDGNRHHSAGTVAACRNRARSRLGGRPCPRRQHGENRPRRPAAARMVVLCHRWPADRQRSRKQSCCRRRQDCRRAPPRRACCLSTEIPPDASGPARQSWPPSRRSWLRYNPFRDSGRIKGSGTAFASSPRQRARDAEAAPSAGDWPRRQGVTPAP